MRLVDIHTHVFNARHVPIRSFIENLIQLPPVILDLLEKVLNALTEAKLPASTHDMLNYGSHGLMVAPVDPSLDVHGLATQWAAILRTGRGEAVNAAVDNLLKHFKGESVILDASMPKHGGAGASLELVDKFRDKCLHFALEQLLTFVGKALEKKGVLNYTRFLSYLLEDENVLAHRLVQEYDGVAWSHRRFGIMMMDMERGCHQKSYFSYPEQINRMKVLKEIHGDDALIFVAFDPRREDSLDLVQQAIRDGFTGIKIYPPMGYRPLGNDDNSWDTALRKLYTYAVAGRIPVMTHCTPTGAEAQPGWGLCSHPRYWAKVLNEFPGLVLCFAHAGGGDQTKAGTMSKGWCAADEDDWNSDANMARWVVELCCSYPNVYCDFSAHGYLIAEQHLSGIPCKNAREQKLRFEKRFKCEMERSTPVENHHNIGQPTFPFASKVMYGSDWHMPGQVGLCGAYLGYWWSLFDRLRYPPDGFIYKHAETFLDGGIA